MRFALIALALLLPATATGNEPGPAQAAQNSHVPTKGVPYRAARAMLIAQGYEPGPVPPNAAGCNIGFEDICKAYKETVICYGTGLAGCEYLFFKGNRALVVRTHGEEIEYQRIAWTKSLSLHQLAQRYGE